MQALNTRNQDIIYPLSLCHYALLDNLDDYSVINVMPHILKPCVNGMWTEFIFKFQHRNPNGVKKVTSTQQQHNMDGLLDIATHFRHHIEEAVRMTGS